MKQIEKTIKELYEQGDSKSISKAEELQDKNAEQLNNLTQ
jgi:hypothetical protein